MMSKPYRIHMTNITDDDDLIVTVMECSDLRQHIGHELSCASAEKGAALYCVTCDDIVAYTDVEKVW